MKKKFKKLLDDLQKIHVHIEPIEPTFLDISGFPHYENVCSNILQFFFETKEAHGMGDLFIQALFKTVGENVSCPIVVNSVEREQITASGKRMDITISTDDYVIGIENKIYALLNNDLLDYSNHLQSISNGRKIIKIVLSLYPIGTHAGFVSITYKDLFNCIDNLIGNYWRNSNRKFLDYLNDFMQNIKRLEGVSIMDNELIDFIDENIQDVEDLYSKLNDLKKVLRQRVQDLGKRMKYDDKKCKQWLWREDGRFVDDLVHDIHIDDAIIAIDTYAYPKGWEINIWLRKSNLIDLKNKDDLKAWLMQHGVPKEDIHVNQYRNVYKRKMDEVEAVAQDLQKLLMQLCN